MEILFISHKHPPSVGGMEKQSFELVQGIERTNKVHRLIHDNKSGKLFFLLNIHNKIRKILKNNPAISMIHLNDGLMAFFCYKIKKITNLPVLVTIHGLDIVFPNSFFQKRIIKVLNTFDQVIAVSNATAKECIKRGISKSKVSVIKNGIDHDLGKIKQKDDFKFYLEYKLGIDLTAKKILVSLGRSVERKGFSWFIKNIMPVLDREYVYLMVGPKQRTNVLLSLFFCILPNKIKKQLFLFLGYPSDYNNIVKELKKPENKSRVFHLGKVPYHELKQILKYADIFVMPNIKVYGDTEGFGLVALEAAITETPVIASGIEGITDAIIDQKNGLLIQPENVQEWKEKIESLKDRISASNFGKKAKDYTLQNYSWAKMVNEYEQIFYKTIKA